jgi:hypothetical protein
MERKYNLFFKILKSLDDKGILEDIILIGSWCQYFYKRHFSNSPEIPILRTLDIDFLIPNPPKFHNKVNVPEILEKLNFLQVNNYLTGYTKYVHPELELEFLIAELGRGKGNEPYKITQLNINAQGLRFLNLLQSHTIKMKYKNLNVTLPEPAAYVLHKLIICERRKNAEKQKRDLLSAKGIGEFLLKNKNQQKKLAEVFNKLPKKWQKNITNNSKNISELIYNFLINIGSTLN